MKKAMGPLGLAVAVLALSAGASRAEAGIVNGSFETGDLTGWSTPQGLVTVTTFEAAVKNPNDGSGSGPPSYAPTDGFFFAYLSAGAGPDVYTTLSQAFTANAGDVLTFDVFFDAGDTLPFNDSAYAAVTDQTTGLATPLFTSDVATVGEYGGTDWTRITYAIPIADSYELTVGVANGGGGVGDNNFPSFAGLDNVVLTSGGGGIATPEPSTLLAAAVLTGVSALGVARRARLSAATF